MDPTITLFSIIVLLGAAHGLFLALALINAKGGNTTAHRFLALLTLAFAIDLGHEFLYQSRILLSVLELAYIDPNINLLYGPSFYLYVRSLTEGSEFRFKKNQWLHFLPFVFGTALCALLPELSKEQFFKLLYDDAALADNKEEFVVLIVVASVALSSVLLIGIYLILSIRRLIRHARMIRQQFSSIEQISFRWLRNLLVALSVLYLVLLFDGFLSQAFGFDQEINKLLYLMVVGVIYTMGYLGLRQPIIFAYPSQETSAAPLTAQEAIKQEKLSQLESGQKRKYEKSALDTEMSAALLAELQHHMNTEKPYFDCSLTLTQLAGQLGISSNYLSQVINEQLKINFFDFINHHRVEEAKRLLADPGKTKKNILAIALESGFNSKSAFYTAFKKHTGITPTQFRSTF